MAAKPSTISPRLRGRGQAAASAAIGAADWAPRVLIRVPHIVALAEGPPAADGSAAVAAGATIGGNAVLSAARSLGRYLTPVRRAVAKNYLLMSAAAVGLLALILFFHGRGNKADHEADSEAPLWNGAAESPGAENSEHLLHSAQESAGSNAVGPGATTNSTPQNWSPPANQTTPTNIPSANMGPRQDGIVPGRAGDSRDWPNPPLRPDDFRSSAPGGGNWPGSDRGWPAAQNNGPVPPIQAQQTRWNNWPSRDNPSPVPANAAPEYRTARSNNPAVIPTDHGPTQRGPMERAPMEPAEPGVAHLEGMIVKPPQ